MRPDVSLIPAPDRSTEKRVPLTPKQRAQLALDQNGRCGCGCGGKLDDLLRRTVSFDSAAGVFTWLPRPASSFASAGAYRSWTAKFAGKPAFSHPDVNGYRVGRVHGVRYKAHRMAWLLVHGHWPTDCIDHINGDRSDNRIANLRDVPKAVNARNAKRRVNCTSGATGVHWNRARQKWRAIIHYDKRCIHLGLFDTIEEAVSARRAANDDYGFGKHHGRAA